MTAVRWQGVSFAWPDGTSVLDNSMIVYCSGLSDGNRHAHDNLPVILAGRAGGVLTPGRHLALTRRQVSKVKSVARAIEASGARVHATAITVQDLRPLKAEKSGEEA